MCRDTCRHIYIYFNFKFVRSQPTILSFSNLANVQPKHNQPPKKEKKKRNSSHTLHHLQSSIPVSSSTFLASRISSPDVLVSLVNQNRTLGIPTPRCSRWHAQARWTWRPDEKTRDARIQWWWSDGIWWLLGPRGGFFVGFLFRLGKRSVFIVAAEVFAGAFLKWPISEGGMSFWRP